MKRLIYVISITFVCSALLFSLGIHASAQRLQTPPARKAPSHSQPSTPLHPQSGRVTTLRAVAAPSTYTGTCSANGKRIVFHGTVTASGPAEVKYTWLRSDGATDNNPHELRFTAAGSKQVSDYWDITESYNGWEALKITAPNQMTSPHAAFRLSCASPKKPANTPPPKRPGQTTALPKPGHAIH